MIILHFDLLVVRPRFAHSFLRVKQSSATTGVGPQREMSSGYLKTKGEVSLKRIGCLSKQSKRGPMDLLDVGLYGERSIL